MLGFDVEVRLIHISACVYMCLYLPYVCEISHASVQSLLELLFL